MADREKFHSPLAVVFVKALMLAEEQNAPEIGVAHLLAALDSPTSYSEPPEPADGPFVPTPRRDKFLSNDAKAAIEAAGSDFERLKGTSRIQAWVHEVTE